jgi:hypothetical protein
MQVPRWALAASPGPAAELLGFCTAMTQLTAMHRQCISVQ